MMNQNRIWMLIGALVIVAMVAGTWFLAVSPRLAEAALADENRGIAETQNAAQQATLTRLKNQFAEIDTLRSDLETVQLAVPEEANQSPLLGQLSEIAAARGITITGLSLTDPVPFAPFPTEDTLLSGPMASLTPENFFSYTIQVSLTGSYEGMVGFVADLQSGERLILVNNLALTEGDDDGPAYTLSGQAFMLVDAETAAANAPVDPATEEAAATEGATPQ